MSLSFTLASARKDLARRARDPLAIALWLGLPLMVGLLLSLASGSGRSQGPRGVVLLADEDASLVGRLIEGSLTQGSLGSLFQVTRTDATTGQARVAAGDASALIVVPKGATEAVLDQAPLKLTLLTNPAQRILPGIVRETLELQVEAAFYLQRVFGPELRALGEQVDNSASFPTSAAVSSLASAISDRLRVLRTVALPPVLDLRIEEAGARPAEAGGLGFGRVMIPGLLFMSLLFIAQGMTADVWEEQTQGTLRRALVAPTGIASFLAGKLVAGTVLMAAVSLVGLTVGVLLFEIPAWRALAAWPWCIFAGAILLAVFLVPQVAASSQRTANLVASMMVFPLMMIGGSFFPFDAMPPWMAAAGRWTPNGQGVARLQGLLTGTAAWNQLIVSAVVMAVPAAVAFAWAARRLQHRFDGGAR